jgi:colanic acid biosynthesis glycosyl transferase WcaI
MNILIITPHFHPENFRINDFAEAFAGRGHSITVLTSVPNYPAGRYFEGYGLFKNNREVYKGIHIYRIPVIPRGSGSPLRLAINYISYVVGGIFTSLFLMKKELDIIFVFEPSPITIGLPAIFIKKMKNIPIIFWVLDLWPESVVSASSLKSSIVPNLLTPIVKFIYHHCDRILVSSKGFINSIAEKDVSKEKIEYYPQWAEPLFRPMSTDGYLLKSIPKDSFKIMFAGNIGEAQDFPSIVEAARLLKSNSNIHWIILGGGRKESWVRKKVEEYQLQDCFHLMGTFPLEKMPEFYSNADAMLFSLKREDIFALTVPAKVQSYLACGKPILAMIDGEGASIIEESDAGYTSPAETPDMLAENALRMATISPLQLLEMGQRARKYYDENFERSFLFEKAESMFIAHHRDHS